MHIIHPSGCRTSHSYTDWIIMTDKKASEEPKEDNTMVVIAAASAALLMTAFTVYLFVAASIGFAENPAFFTNDIENPFTRGGIRTIGGVAFLVMTIGAYRMTLVTWKERHMILDVV